MNLRSQHLANMGARLGRVPVDYAKISPARSAGPAREAASQARGFDVLTPKAPDGASALTDDARSGLRPAAGTVDSRASPDATVGVTTSGDRFELTLTPNVQATLLLAAKAAGVTPAEFVARAIVVYAQEAVGFPALADELFEAPEAARIKNSRFRSAADQAGVPP